MFSLDHLVFATPDLEATTAWFEERSGVAPTPGGQHVGMGTRNTLVGMGGATYLEIVGPDLEQPEPELPRPFGIDALDEPTLVTWAVGASDLANQVERCRSLGVVLGDAIPMSRAKPDGSLLEWSLTIPAGAPSLVPFLIDWRGSPTPAESLGHPIALVELTAESPDVDASRRMLEVIGVELPVRTGSDDRLLAVLETPNGRLELGR